MTRDSRRSSGSRRRTKCTPPSASPQQDDCVFHYKLGTEEPLAQRERVLEFLRSTLRELLNLLILTQEGKEIEVDGFKLLRDRDFNYDIFPPTNKEEQKVDSTSIYEPRIDFIKKQMEALLSVVELEADGKPVKVDGFKLKNLQDWLVPSACDPIEVFGHLATRCSCDCLFCYLKGNPPSVALKQSPRSAEEEYQEAMTRLKHFSPQSQQCLFPTLGGIYESLTHPRSLEVLHLLRRKTSLPLRIATNGDVLTAEVIDQLKDLRPVYLYLSLNSCSPQRRAQLMKTKLPQLAIDALPLLRDRRIPYAVVTVPWPADSLDEMLEDLTSTIAYADDNHSHLVQVNLPGYSRHFSDQKLFDLEEVWSAIVREIRELRAQVSCPIVAMPTMYEENLYEGVKNLPRVIGLGRNSPAALAGLRQGDILRQVNGIVLRNRPQARDVLSLLQRSGDRKANIVVERGNQNIDLKVDLRQFYYPYDTETSNHLGVVFLGTGFRLSNIERLREIIKDSSARHVLLLTSPLIKPVLEQCLGESRLLSQPDLRLDIEIPQNRFFGGNVHMGDLLVVQDFIDHVKAYIGRTGDKPDLVVIPSTPFALGQWGRDLTGRVYLDIKREVGISIELLDCETIYE